MTNIVVGDIARYSATASVTDRPFDIFTYSWSFDDGTVVSGPSVLHAWSTLGSHTATITVADTTLGISNTASAVVNVVSL
jgi:chitodextrinase